MKNNYLIKDNAYRDGKVCQEYIVRFIVLPSPPFEEDKRPVLRVELTDNVDDALFGSKEVITAICKFINKVAPHFGARVV